MNNNGTMITEVEVDMLLGSGEVYGFYPTRELAEVVEEDLFFLLAVSQEHGVTINWGAVTPEEVQELAALERASGEHAASAWGGYGFGAYARKEASERAERLLMVQAGRLNETVNACISEAV